MTIARKKKLFCFETFYPKRKLQIGHNLVNKFRSVVDKMR